PEPGLRHAAGECVATVQSNYEGDRMNPRPVTPASGPLRSRLSLLATPIVALALVAGCQSNGDSTDVDTAGDAQTAGSGTNPVQDRVEQKGKDVGNRTDQKIEGRIDN